MTWKPPTPAGPRLDISKMSTEAGRQLFELVWPRNEIKDFNIIGLESVPSEDFDPGFGCVVFEPIIESAPPSMPPLVHTEHELWLYHENSLSERERHEEQMEYLRSKGVY